MSRPRRRSWLAGAGLVVVLAAGGVAAYLVAGNGDDAAAGQPLATTTARRATLTQTVDASFTLAGQDAAKLASPAAGTVTSVALADGATVKALTKLVGVDGAAVYGVPSAYPLYRNLAEGDEGPDVTAVQKALAAAGYDPGDTDGDFGAGTAAALEDWQADHDLDETGRLDLASFVSYPPGSLVQSVAVQVGDRVGVGAALATIAPAGLLAEVDVTQLDIGRLKVGQHVELTFDGLDGATAAGRVSDLASAAEQSSGSAGTSTVVDYQVTVRPARLPAGARAGMTGQASVVTASRADVVVVPSSAIGGSASAPTVQVVADGGTVTRPVIVGLVTDQGSEILTGLRPGEQVVTGVAGSRSSTQTTLDRGGGGLGGPVVRGGGIGP